MNSPVLLARELRWQTRLRLVGSLNRPVISITLRAPSRLRQLSEYRAAFDLLCKGLERLFFHEGLVLEPLLSTFDAEGPARHYAAEDALTAKRLCARFEEEATGGELLDIDLMDEHARPLSRGDIGVPPRACMVCGARPAALCVAGQRHDQGETEAAFERVLRKVLLSDAWIEHVARTALKSLLYEVSVTPKPGLVDRDNPGAHGDMDYYSFIDSAAALAPYFSRCAALGRDSLCGPGDMLARLRPLGMEAEEAMKRATGGANTHKGLIFSLGILCAAAGRLGEGTDAGTLCELAARIAAPALHDQPDGSHGDLARERYGALGARGEAAGGFPAARLALRTLGEALDAGESVDRAGVKALLRLMAGVRDTNVLYRAGEEGLAFVQSGARSLLMQGVPDEELERFCADVTQRRVSPGGCADLLAIAFFLRMLFV